MKAAGRGLRLSKCLLHDSAGEGLWKKKKKNTLLISTIEAVPPEASGRPLGAAPGLTSARLQLN